MELAVRPVSGSSTPSGDRYSIDVLTAKENAALALERTVGV